MKAVVMRIREIILAADPRIDAFIKWQAPTFTYLGNIASFYPKSRQHSGLMFHQGAKIPGSHPRLEGTGDTSRVVKIASLAQAEEDRDDLERIVRAWCTWRTSQGADTKPAPRKRTGPKGAAKNPPKRAASRRPRSGR